MAHKLYLFILRYFVRLLHGFLSCADHLNWTNPITHSLFIGPKILFQTHATCVISRIGICRFRLCQFLGILLLEYNQIDEFPTLKWRPNYLIVLCHFVKSGYLMVSWPKNSVSKMAPKLYLCSNYIFHNFVFVIK